MNQDSVNDVKIDEMRADDVAAVKALELAGGLSVWSEEDYRSEIARPDALTIVARSGNEVVAFAVARLITISNYADQNAETHFEMELNNLAVASSFRRAGVATRIFRELLKRLPAASRIFLEVREKNTGARAFYKALGMMETGVRKNFYRQPTDNAIVMSAKASEIATNLILKTKID